MLKRFFAAALVCAVCAVCLAGCCGRGLTLVAVTDIHYAGRENYAYTGSFLLANDTNGSGKQMRYLDDILDAFIAEMLEQKPDVILLTGDNTYSGARESHEGLVQKLRALTEAGIVVLTVPGNHDIVRWSYLFPGGEPVQTESLTADGFREVYADFGYGDALSCDEQSLSYVYDTGRGVRLFMLDTNFVYGTGLGQLRDTTLAWLEGELRACAEAGDIPLAAGHHNLAVHNPLFTTGYTLGNAQQVAELFERYGVELYLSGHLHPQHIARAGSVTDVAGGSFAVYPHRCGTVRLEGGEWEYLSHETDVAGYARRQGIEDENLLGYPQYGFDFFYGNAYAQARRSLEGLTDDAALLDDLCDLSAQCNVYYFGGTPSLIDRTHEAEFERVSEGTRWGAYIRSVLDEQGDHLSCGGED